MELASSPIAAKQNQISDNLGSLLPFLSPPFSLIFSNISFLFSHSLSLSSLSSISLSPLSLSLLLSPLTWTSRWERMSAAVHLQTSFIKTEYLPNKENRSGY